jgi:IclR family transcriptional regulator, pca regulon regulatory protein
MGRVPTVEERDSPADSATQVDPAQAAEPQVGKRSESLESLERQMAVLEAFTAERPSLTLSEVARLTGTTRPTARRILLTLKALGYLRSDDRQFSLTPKVLNFGWSYFSTLSLEETVQPILRDLVQTVDESCSVGALALPDIVYISRAFTRRIMTVSGRVGSRQPAHATALGHVLLAHLGESDLNDYLEKALPLEAFTPRTLTDPDELRAELREVRAQGWALVDQELEAGLRSIAAPIVGPQGEVVAALSISSNSARTMLADLRRHLPVLLQTAGVLSPAFKLNEG